MFRNIPVTVNICCDNVIPTEKYNSVNLINALQGNSFLSALLLLLLNIFIGIRKKNCFEKKNVLHYTNISLTLCLLPKSWVYIF